MRLPLKTIAAPLFLAAARANRAMRKVGRLWAFAQLQAAVRRPVPTSTVVLGVPEVHGAGEIRLGRDLYLYPGLYLETQAGGSISIGDRVVISRGVHIVSFARIEIGPGSMIGEYASIRDANHAYGNGGLRDGGHKAKPVTIGSNVWIGRGAAVLAGVRIGDNAVVGANAVVTRDVAEGEVVAGVPARPIAARRAA